MRKPDPAWPSFTVMSYELQKDSLRLPTYRESMFFRFHPYPQTHRKAAEPLMQTVDYRSVESVARTVADERAPLSTNEGSGSDEAALNLECAMNDTEDTCVKKRNSLTSLIIDLALAITGTRRLKGWQSTTKLDSGQ